MVKKKEKSNNNNRNKSFRNPNFRNEFHSAYNQTVIGAGKNPFQKIICSNCVENSSRQFAHFHLWDFLCVNGEKCVGALN